MKIVINSCFGGFGLLNKGIKRYLELQGKECWFYKQTKYEQNDGKFSYLKIVEIPDDVEWEIDDYDGIETIHEVHRSWS